MLSWESPLNVSSQSDSFPKTKCILRVGSVLIRTSVDLLQLGLNVDGHCGDCGTIGKWT